MKKIVILLVGVALGALVTAVVAQERYIYGVLSSHEVTEKFHMSVGVTSTGAPGREVLQKQYRQQLNLPSHYGALVGVTGNNDLVVLWYQDADGVVRNAIVEKPANQLYRVVPTPVEGYEELLYR